MCVPRGSGSYLLSSLTWHQSMPHLENWIPASWTGATSTSSGRSKKSILCECEAGHLHFTTTSLPPISNDDVVIFRLSRFSKHIRDVLCSSPELATCHQRVEDAGCEVAPAFTEATLLKEATNTASMQDFLGER